jgi:micrococcal nuclease
MPRAASCVLPIVMALLACACSRSALAAADEPPADEHCALEAGSSHTVACIVDAETIVVDDGSEVRLIGALAPRSPTAGSTDWPPEHAAREALERLLLGRNVEIKLAGRRSDCYGRRLAHVFAVDGSEKVWVQGHLLSRGLVRVYALVGNTACLSEMLELERKAREEGHGIWAVAAYRVLEATEVGELLRRRNRLEVVEGVVRDVAFTGGRVYLNFGADWRRDFTAVVPPRLVRGSPETAAQRAVGRDCGFGRDRNRKRQ